MQTEIDFLSHYLTSHQKKMATAESCTGGLIAKSVTDRAGSSDWFEGGMVTYSNRCKVEWLGVELQLLEQYGAVSEQVASSMVTGLLKRSEAEVALSVTGIAGPGGGSREKPVGTVCFAWGVKSAKPETLTHHLQGDRAQIRLQSATIALSGLVELCKRID